MFELIFKYPQAVYSKGNFVLLSSWPVWLLLLFILVVAAALAAPLLRRTPTRRAAVKLTLRQRLTLWGLQAALAAFILLLLWQPAISVPALRPQQNIVAVVVDDSQSMAIREGGTSRLEAAATTLQDGLLHSLRQRFQVRLYRMGRGLERVEGMEQYGAAQTSSQIAGSLRQLVAEAGSVPIGAVVLLTDGADNAGGIDLETVSQIRRHRIPVHTIGFGSEQMVQDVEILDASVPARALPGSRLQAHVSFRQNGFSGKKARLTIKDAGKPLASEELTLSGDARPQFQPVFFNAGAAGARNLEITIEPLTGETNLRNNSLTRLVNVESARPRILYIEGEPRWEFKFIRRAMELDGGQDLVTILRTTQNKIYRQGIREPQELEQGFPARAEELFEFSGIIIGSVEANYFTPDQAELIRQFADRRGGGVLFLGGRHALSEGGYAKSGFNEMMPVNLPDKKDTFHRVEAPVALTASGRDSLICRIEESTEKNAERWRKLPMLADYQEVGSAKPGALVLAEITAPRAMPLLVTQSYGRGRTAVLASSGTWRWQMLQDHQDLSHEMFWQQLLRWLVADSLPQVSSATPRPVMEDVTRVPIRIEARDKAYLPVSDAHAEARILGPGGVSATVPLTPVPEQAGIYEAEWDAVPTGSYLAEAVVVRGTEEVGRSVLMFRREDGVAEHFRTEQNRELLQALSTETGGRYYRPADAKQLADEIAYSEAGISVRETRDLWNLPLVFVLLLALPATEWMLRRKWGII
jgi:uncharacterized membrane protein